MKKSVILGLAGVLMAVPAQAQANDFPNLRIEANVGVDRVKGALNYQDSAFPADDFSGSRKSTGLVYGGTVGADFPIAGGYFGVEASADFGDNRRCEEVFGADRACFKVGRTFAAGVRGGTPIGKQALLYVGAAWVNGRAKISYHDDVDPTNDFAFSDNRDGYRLSAGVEYRLTGDVFAKMEYRYSDFDNYRASAGTESVSLGFTRHQVVTGIGVRF